MESIFSIPLLEFPLTTGNGIDQPINDVKECLIVVPKNFSEFSHNKQLDIYFSIKYALENLWNCCNVEDADDLIGFTFVDEDGTHILTAYFNKYPIQAQPLSRYNIAFRNLYENLKAIKIIDEIKVIDN